MHSSTWAFSGMPRPTTRSGNFGAVSRLADAVRRRPWVYRSVRRALATRPVRLARSPVLRPAGRVLGPFYDVEDYLAACLDSILAQGFSDFEVLLVDDGSP